MDIHIIVITDLLPLIYYLLTIIFLYVIHFTYHLLHDHLLYFTEYPQLTLLAQF